MSDKLNNGDFYIFNKKTGENNLVSKVINNWMEQNELNFEIRDSEIYCKTNFKNERIGSVNYCQTNNCVDFKISLFASTQAFGTLIRNKYRMENDLGIKIEYSGHPI